jgi:hypothetical protein
LRDVLEQRVDGMVPLRLVLFDIVRDCKERGKAPGTACARLLLSKWSWVRTARDEMDAGIEPESELEERSRTSKEPCKLLLFAKLSMGFDSLWFLIIRVCSGRLVMEVKSPANCRFAINVKSVTLVNKENKSSGIVVMAVDSRWSVVRDVRLRNESGKTPAGELPSPITCRDCN